MRRVLLVSPHFPPTNAPDHQRVRMSLPFYREHGWDPVVLAVDSASVENTCEPLLAETLPADITVHRVAALPARWTRRIGLGNIAYRAWFQLRAAGDRLLRETPFDLVYFSTTQFVATTLGARWLKRFGVPFVVDLQDPWRTDYYERPGAPRPPGGWKYRFAHWQAARLEERAWRDAAGFTSVNDTYLAQLGQRYPWFVTKPSAVIPFGAAASDFTVARTHADIASAFAPTPGLTHLVSVGAAGPIMRAALVCLFAGLRDFRAQSPALAARLRLHFVGTSYAPRGLARPTVTPIAAEFGVADLVAEQPERVGYFSALKTMLAGDALIIPGSDDPSYSPSKIAACYLADRPTLALAPVGSAFARQMAELSFATLVTPPSLSSARIIAEFLHVVLSAPAGTVLSRPRSALFESTHSARARTGQECALFDRALAARPAA